MRGTHCSCICSQLSAVGLKHRQCHHCTRWHSAENQRSGIAPTLSSTHVLAPTTGHTVQAGAVQQLNTRPLPWPQGASACKLRAVVTGRRRMSKRLVFVDIVPLSSLAGAADGDMPERSSWAHPSTGAPSRCDAPAARTLHLKRHGHRPVGLIPQLLTHLVEIQGNLGSRSSPARREIFSFFG